MTITDGAVHTATTNSNGNYTLSGLTTGTYTITPSKSGYTFSPTSRMVTVPPDASGQDFTATRIYGGLSGRVSEKSSGEGVANARVSVGGKVERTNANGQYTINNIPTGTHTIRVSADGYKSYKGQVTIQASLSVTRDVVLERQPSEGYRLPFPGGKKYKCTQGNNGPYSHYGRWRYAFDWWSKDVEDEVVAARDGRVVAVKEDSSTGGCNKKYANYCNYVIIQHRDGTKTLYLHLKHNSVPVSLKDYVKSGQVIGRIGETGWVCGAHLHFERCEAKCSSSIPTRFLDVSSNNGVPQGGQWYRSGNYLVSSLDSLAALEEDTEPPEGSVQFRLTGQPTHQLWLDAFDYVSDDLQMRLAPTYADLQTAVWQPFSGSVEWTLPEVWVQYRDEDSNVSDVYSDTIDAIAYEPIQAAFAISPTVCADSVVPLDNLTTPFCEQCGWNWDFGDGTSSIEAYPLFPDIAYADPGTYTVTLTVAGAMNISSVSKQVTVLPSPSPDFTMIRSGTTITVEASVADAASWEWDFGDGITATGRTATHTYTEPLTEAYPVQLTVRGTNGCVGVGYQYVTQSEIYLPIIMKSY